MSETVPPIVKPKIETKPKVERPKLYKVILLNDDYTPRGFVVTVLQKVFRVPEARANQIMLTAHQRGACVVAVYTRELAEQKVTEAMDMAKSKGHPLTFSTEPEE